MAFEDSGAFGVDGIFGGCIGVGEFFDELLVRKIRFCFHYN